MGHTWTVVALLSLLVCIYIHAVPTDNQNEKLITKLSGDFHKILQPNRLQYGVMYMHPPNANFNAIVYVPRSPKPPVGTSPVTYPVVTLQNKDNFPFSYVATTPDFNWTYGPMMRKTVHATIHTEDLNLNLVFPGMSFWYKKTYSKNPKYLYMYTYFLPCPRCVDFITDFITRNKGIRLYVGYGQLYGGNREDDEGKRAQTRKRRAALEKSLTKADGMLYLIPTDEILHYLSDSSEIY